MPSIQRIEAKHWSECVELATKQSARRAIENAYNFQWFALAASLAPKANYGLGKKETPKFND
jgi:hypothetical protein